MGFVTRLDKKLLTSWDFKKLGQEPFVGSAVVCCTTSFVEQVAMVCNYTRDVFEGVQPGVSE